MSRNSTPISSNAKRNNDKYDFTTILNDQNSRHEKDIKQLNEKNDKLNEKIDEPIFLFALGQRNHRKIVAIKSK